MRQWRDRYGRASGFAAGFALALGLACGDDEPTGVGRELRTHPDTLHAVELPNAVRDSVFAVPVSLRSSPSGQIGAQGPYTAQILYDFRVPSFVVDEGETLRLDTGRFEIKLAKQSQPPFAGAMRLALREVALEARGWSSPAVYDSMVLTALPELRPGFVADEVLLVGDSLTATAPELELALEVRRLADYDSVLAQLGTLEVNVALVFLGFATGGPGFLEFSQVSASGPAPRFFGNYRDPQGGTTGIESAVAPQKQLVVVEFDSTYATGTNWVVSDAHRFHTFFEFPDLRSLPDSVLPRAAIVHRADLILVQADSTTTIFGTGPQFGVIVPSDAVLADSTLVFSLAENNRGIAFQSDLTADPGGQVSLAVTTYFFDQQEGTVKNRGMILRLSNEGTKARQFVFHGSRAAAPALRPRLRLLYALPSDFGGE